MLPALQLDPAKLQSFNGPHRACNKPASIGVVLDAWGDREESLTPEQFEQLRGGDERNAECSICFERLSDPGTTRSSTDRNLRVLAAVDNPTLSCGHAFHLECALKWFDGQRDLAKALTCPACTRPFVDQYIDQRYNYVDGRRPPAPPPRRQFNFMNTRLHYGMFYELGFDGLISQGWHYPLIPNMSLTNATRAVIGVFEPPIYYGLSVPRHPALDFDYELYCYEKFMRATGAAEEPTLEEWRRVTRLGLYSSTQLAFFTYWIARSQLKGIVQGATNLVLDVHRARLEGSSWAEIFRAIVLGEEPA